MSNKKIFKKLYKEKINKQDNYKQILNKINTPSKKNSIYKKVLIPVCSLLLILNIIIINLPTKDATFIEIEDNNKEYEIYINNNNKNNSSITSTFSSDNVSDVNNHKKIDIDYEKLIQSPNYSFLNKLKIPNDLDKREYKKVYQKENNNSNLLKNYEFSYQNKNGRNIIISFKDKYETMKDESSKDYLKISKIKETEIIIYQEESSYTATFIFNNQYFYIKTNNINKEELINLLVSIIK